MRPGYDAPRKGHESVRHGKYRGYRHISISRCAVRGASRLIGFNKFDDGLPARNVQLSAASRDPELVCD